MITWTRGPRARLPLVIAGSVVTIALAGIGAFFVDHPRSGAAAPTQPATSVTASTSTSMPPRPVPTPTGAPTPTPPDPHILIVGDSLIRQSRTPIAELLSDFDVDIRAEAGTTVGDWTAYLPDLIERESPDVLVVALGTNDNLAADEPAGADLAKRVAAYGTRVDTLLDVTADVPCRVWIEPSPLGFGRYRKNAPDFNARLRATLAEHGVRVVSWGDRMVSGDAFGNGWMRSDTIHLTDRGQIAYGALAANAARDGCP